VITARSITHTDRRSTPLTLALIVVNVAVWVIGFAVPDARQWMFENGAQQNTLISTYGEWWRGLTAMFLHSTSMMHILFNMWALWLFGPALERRWGTVPFGTLYLAAGLTGSALFHVFGRLNAAVGASGAIFGLFGALLVGTYQRRHTATGRAAFTQLAVLLAVNMVLPFVARSIAWEAHVGGLLAGLVIAFAWDRLPARGPHPLLQRAVVALAAAAVALAALIVV
jgi:membrane associated rhomboid family serine protease